MDIEDVSTASLYRAQLDSLKRQAANASRRNGQIPKDHPFPQLLVGQFMTNLMIMANHAGQDNFQIATSQIPPSYPPSIVSAQDLQPLMLSRMRLGHHHRGHYVLAHAMTPPSRMTAVMAIVEDEEGTATLLQLYNQPEEDTVNNQQILRKGDVCIIKEPFFKDTTSGGYSLRVDHVSDIMWLQESDDRIPLQWRKRILLLDESSSSIRKEGNEAVQKEKWVDAERLYTRAINTATTPEEKQMAHLNRSLANLRLDRPEKAVEDARLGNGNSVSEKALFREAKGLYALEKYSPCLERLLELVRINPGNSEAWAEVKRTKERLREETAASYSFGSMHKQAKATPPSVDCATFVGPVEVLASAGRGNGMFTTRAVKAGEMLLCEKAFAYCYAGNDNPAGKQRMTVLMDVNSDSASIGGQAHLITQIVQKLHHSPAAAEVFTQLHHGDYQPVAVREVDGSPVVDSFLVTQIIRLNSFGAPRSSFESARSGNSTGAHSTCGVWCLASRINHSCVTNCRRAFIGDMQIIRACRDLEANTELTFAYHAALPHATYKETQAQFKSWGFVCHCSLCLDKNSTPQRALNRRKTLIASLLPILKPTATVAQLKRARQMMEEFEDTYTAPDPAILVPRMELWDPYFGLGRELIVRGETAAALEMYLKGLEALGFIVEAWPPRKSDQGVAPNKNKLEIKRWGHSTEYTATAFLQMMHVYETVAPDLCDIAKEYATVAYSICSGERDTVGSLFQLSPS